MVSARAVPAENGTHGVYVLMTGIPYANAGDAGTSAAASATHEQGLRKYATMLLIFTLNLLFTGTLFSRTSGVRRIHADMKNCQQRYTFLISTLKTIKTPSGECSVIQNVGRVSIMSRFTHYTGDRVAANGSTSEFHTSNTLIPHRFFTTANAESIRCSSQQLTTHCYGSRTMWSVRMKTIVQIAGLISLMVGLAVALAA